MTTRQKRQALKRICDEMNNGTCVLFTYQISDIGEIHLSFKKDRNLHNSENAVKPSAKCCDDLEKLVWREFAVKPDDIYWNDSYNACSFEFVS